MDTKKKAEELGIKWRTPCHGAVDCEYEVYQSAMEMAEWKDKQWKEKLEAVLEKSYDARKNICRNDMSFLDCTQFIKWFRKEVGLE